MKGKSISGQKKSSLFPKKLENQLNPEERALELLDKYENVIYENVTDTGNGIESLILAWRLSLITVDEILTNELGEKAKYWEAVKLELEGFK